jgi:hypothetical protein
MVLDAYGTKEGHFVLRNVWGKGDTMSLPAVCNAMPACRVGGSGRFQRILTAFVVRVITV